MGLLLSSTSTNWFLHWRFPAVVIQAGETVLVRTQNSEFTEVLKRMETNFNLGIGQPVWLICGITREILMMCFALREPPTAEVIAEMQEILDNSDYEVIYDDDIEVEVVYSP